MAIMEPTTTSATSPTGSIAVSVNDELPDYEPIREATLASTIQRLLLDVRAVGGEREWTPGGTAASALVIDAVTLSGA